MLTLKQINEVSFRKSNFSGYKPEDVDKFIDEVTESFTALLKENQAYKAKADELTEKNKDLKVKVVALVERLETYRNDEKGIKDALINAQKVSEAQLAAAKEQADAVIAEAEETARARVGEANEEAEAVLAAAREEAQAIVDEATDSSSSLLEDYQAQIEVKKKQLDAMSQAVEDFRSELFEIYKTHIDLISNIPQYTFEDEEAEYEEADEEEYQEETEEEAAEAEELPLTEEIDTEADDGAAVYEEVMSSPLASDAEEYVPGTADVPVVEPSEDETRPFDSFDIDLNAFADMPEEVKKEKEALYQTLHFDEDLDVK